MEAFRSKHSCDIICQILRVDFLKFTRDIAVLVAHFELIRQSSFGRFDTGLNSTLICSIVLQVSAIFALVFIFKFSISFLAWRISLAMFAPEVDGAQRFALSSLQLYHWLDSSTGIHIHSVSLFSDSSLWCTRLIDLSGWIWKEENRFHFRSIDLSSLICPLSLSFFLSRSLSYLQFSLFIAPWMFVDQCFAST